MEYFRLQILDSDGEVVYTDDFETYDLHEAIEFWLKDQVE